MKFLSADPVIPGGLAIVVFDNDAAPQLIDAIDIPVAGVGVKERVDAIAVRVDNDTPATARPYRTRANEATARLLERIPILQSDRHPRRRDRVLWDPMTIVEPSQWEKLHQIRDVDKAAGPATGCSCSRMRMRYLRAKRIMVDQTLR